MASVAQGRLRAAAARAPTNKLAVGFAIAALGLGATFEACTASSSTLAYPDFQAFCSAKAKAECQVAPRCSVDPTMCQRSRIMVCVDDVAQATSAGTRHYVAENAQACIDAVNAAYGKDPNGSSEVTFAQLFGPGSIDDKCGHVFAGNAEKGAACASDFECASERVCASFPMATGRVCADPVQKGPGDFCSEPGSMCASDTYCAAQDGGAPQCIPAAVGGEACGAAPCITGYRCAGGFCSIRMSSGQACTSHDDCVSIAPYCDAYAGGICTIGLTFATAAADCHGYGLGASGADAGAGGEGGSGPVADDGSPGTD